MPVQYNLPDSTGIGVDAGSREKMRNHLGPSLHSEVSTTPSDSPPAQGDQEDPFFTTADVEHFIIDLDEEMEITRFNKKKAFVCVDKSCILDDESQRRVYERLVLYRLNAHKLSEGESIDNLDDETLKTELHDFPGKESEHIHSDVDNLGWYFDPEFSKLKDLADYQRLVLTNHDGVEYLDWKGYRLDFSTYKMDKEYVRFFTEISEKLQWLKKYIGTRGTREWLERETRGCRHALKIATKYPSVTDDLLYIAYGEHIWSLHNDYYFCDDWDIIFLEIWKLVTKKQWKFTLALMEVKKKKYVPRHDSVIKRFLTDRTHDLKSKFDFCVKDIPHDAEDGAAKEFIKKEIKKLPRKKTLHQYKVKKIEIAENIGLHKDPIEPPMRTYDLTDYYDNYYDDDDI